MKRVLIIEDDKSISDLERDYLEINKYEVEVAFDGDTGSKMALEENFDLILLDLMLPFKDGFEVCREIRAKKETPILMVTAKKEDIDKIRGLGLGADDWPGWAPTSPGTNGSPPPETPSTLTTSSPSGI